jgi:hypothetical protein
MRNANALKSLYRPFLDPEISEPRNASARKMFRLTRDQAQRLSPGPNFTFPYVKEAQL